MARVAEYRKAFRELFVILPRLLASEDEELEIDEAGVDHNAEAINLTDWAEEYKHLNTKGGN